MDTDDLQLDEDFLTPPQHAALIRPVTRPEFRSQEARTSIPAHTTFSYEPSIPGPAGVSGPAARSQAGGSCVREAASQLGLLCNSPHITSCIVRLEECLPHMCTGSGYSVLLKVRCILLITVRAILPFKRSMAHVLSTKWSTVASIFPSAGLNRQCSWLYDATVLPGTSAIGTWHVHAPVQCSGAPCFRGAEVCLHRTTEYLPNVYESGRCHKFLAQR
jgi:hypothetical protein